MLFWWFIVSALAAPDQYIRNPDIKTDVVIAGDTLYYTFGFNDNFGIYNEWSWADSLSRVQDLSSRFGLADTRATDEELRAGLFKNHPLVGVIPNYGALVSVYRESVADLHASWRGHVDAKGLDLRQSVELLLVFLQDFPYGIPPIRFENRVIAGLFVPPMVFKNGWGDCDSKSLVMATVLSYEQAFRGKMAMILVPGHALLGLEIRPGPYDKIYTYQNRKYVPLEPTGLARTPLGRTNSPYDRVLAIEPIAGGLTTFVPSENPGVDSISF